MEEVGLQEWSGFREESKVFQVKGITRNIPRAGHGPKYFYGTRWGYEQMQLLFICGALGKRSHKLILHQAYNGHSEFYQLQMSN